jgi:hypothetical protein
LTAKLWSKRSKACHEHAHPGAVWYAGSYAIDLPDPSVPGSLDRSPYGRDLICEEQKRGDITSWASCTPFGWFLWAHDEESDLSEFPADLQACMRKAQEHGCDYILFDRDASPAGIALGLPFYEDDCGCGETSHCER